MAENFGSARYNTFISSDSPCFKKAEYQRHWKGVQQGWVQYKRKVFLKTIWEQKWMVLGKKVLRAHRLVVPLCSVRSNLTLQGNIYIFNKPDDHVAAIAQTTVSDCTIESVVGKGENLHRLALVIKDGKKIDISFSSREELEQWATSIREFQAPAPVLKLPEAMSFRK